MHLIDAKILVVEDSQTIRKMMEFKLSSKGYHVETAEDGLQALEKLKNTSYDLILSDILMPNLDGYQLLQSIKDNPVLKHIPVIMLSSYEEIDSVVKCIEMGAEDYLFKHPFNPTLLFARVHALLEKKYLRDQEITYRKELEKEKKRSDDLLYGILPPNIVKELKENNYVQPKRYENVAVMFSDIVGFTKYCDKVEPELVLGDLQQLVEAFEELATYYGLQKIKTIGDSFMATAGLLEPIDNPVLHCVECGLEMVSSIQNLDWHARVGIHVGPVVAGVIGRRQNLFDIWGDTVNTASRVESNGVNSAVNVSIEAWNQVKDHCNGESLGNINVKGKGEIEIYKITGLLNS